MRRSRTPQGSPAMNKLSISRRIIILATSLVVLGAFSGLLAVYQINRISNRTEALTGDALPGLQSMLRMSELVQYTRADFLRHLVTPEKQAELETEIAGLDQKFRQEMAAYEKTIHTDTDRALFVKVGPAWERFRQSVEHVLAASRARRTAEALALMDGEEHAARLALQQALTDEVDLNQHNSDAWTGEAEAAVRSGSSLQLAVLAAVVVCGTGIGWFILGGLNRALARMAAELNEAASQIVSAAGQVASSSQALAQGASEQAASVEETSASATEIASVTQKSREHTTTMANTMDETKANLEVVNTCVEEVTTAMEGIEASSQKVTSVIRVIEELAFQTNILALNAAVEAARAGEAGMGFAVVAEEVRSLAQRSSAAARDTASLIEESLGKSGAGQQSVTRLIERLRLNFELASRVGTLTAEVASASTEQATGIEQIAKAITRIEQVAQNTAASAEESASASAEMSAQGQSLANVVRQLETLVGSGR